MKKIEWKDEYNLDIASIDRQHKKLFDYLNELREGILEHNSVEAISRAIDNLYNYGKEHFAFEENLMKLGDYKVLDEHRQKHIDFNQEIEKYKKKFQQGNEIMATDLIIFIKKWLLEHILIEDKQYANYFVGAGFHCPEMD